MIDPYYSDDRCVLYLGKMEDVLPALGRTFDACVTDCPYGETSLRWDRWVDGWPTLVANVTTSLWAFGSMRMFLEHGAEFTTPGWKFSQDIVWEKHNGSSFANDRFKRVHEHATHWFTGAWSSQRHEAPTTADAVKHAMRRKARPTHIGDIGAASYVSEDGGPRLMRSVIAVRSMHGRALHPTEKPSGILQPLIEYSCPAGGGVARSVCWLGLDAGHGQGNRPSRGRYRGRRDVCRDRREAAVPGRPRLRGCRMKGTG